MRSRGRHGGEWERFCALAFFCFMGAANAVAGEVESPRPTTTPEAVMSLFGLSSLSQAAAYVSSSLGEPLSFTPVSSASSPGVVPKSSSPDPTKQASARLERGDIASPTVSGPGATAPSSGRPDLSPQLATANAPKDGPGTSPLSVAPRTGEQTSAFLPKEDELTRALKLVANTLQSQTKVAPNTVGTTPTALPNLTGLGKSVGKQDPTKKESGEANGKESDPETNTSAADGLGNLGGIRSGTGDTQGKGDSGDSEKSDAEAQKEKEAQEKAAQEKKAQEEKEKQQKVKDLFTAPFEDKEKTNMNNYHLATDFCTERPRECLKFLDSDPQARAMAQSLFDNFGEKGKILPDFVQPRANTLKNILNGTIPDTGSFTGAPTGRTRQAPAPAPVPLGGAPSGNTHSNAEPALPPR